MGLRACLPGPFRSLADVKNPDDLACLRLWWVYCRHEQDVLWGSTQVICRTECVPLGDSAVPRGGGHSSLDGMGCGVRSEHRMPYRGLSPWFRWTRFPSRRREGVWGGPRTLRPSDTCQPGQALQGVGCVRERQQLLPCPIFPFLVPHLFGPCPPPKATCLLLHRCGSCPLYSIQLSWGGLGVNSQPGEA